MPAEQLQLRDERRQQAGVVMDVDVPGRLLDKIRLLSLSQRLRLAQRIPVAIEVIVDELANLGELTGPQLAERISAYRKLLEEMHAERARRSQCPECGAAKEHGHAFGCNAS